MRRRSAAYASPSPLRVLRDEIWRVNNNVRKERRDRSGRRLSAVRAPVNRARPRDRVVVARRAHEQFVQHSRGSECTSLPFGFVQPPFRQLRGDENTNAAREFSETTTSMNDLVSACRTRLGPEGSGAGGEVTGVALSRTIARCPSRESAGSFWTKGCLASSFGVPAFLPVRSVSERDMSLPTNPTHQAPASAVASAVPTRLTGNKYALALGTSFSTHS